MIKGIAHVAFFVSDINKSIDFYVNKLGFKKKFSLNDKSGKLWIVYIEVNNNQFIELFPINDKINNNYEQSYQHLCLEVKNIHKLVKDLEAVGVVIDQPIIMGMDNNYQSWIHDPDGNPIELMEYGADSFQLN